MKFIPSMVVLTISMLLAACNTVEGVGKDIQGGGKCQDPPDYLPHSPPSQTTLAFFRATVAWHGSGTHALGHVAADDGCTSTHTCPVRPQGLRCSQSDGCATLR